MDCLFRDSAAGFSVFLFFLQVDLRYGKRRLGGFGTGGSKRGSLSGGSSSNSEKLLPDEPVVSSAIIGSTATRGARLSDSCSNTAADKIDQARRGIPERSPQIRQSPSRQNSNQSSSQASNQISNPSSH